MTKRDIQQARSIARELGIPDAERARFRRHVERSKRERGLRGDLSYAELRELGIEFLELLGKRDR